MISPGVKQRGLAASTETFISGGKNTVAQSTRVLIKEIITSRHYKLCLSPTVSKDPWQVLLGFTQTIYLNCVSLLSPVVSP